MITRAIACIGSTHHVVHPHEQISIQHEARGSVQQSQKTMAIGVKFHLFYLALLCIS
jgi:hypothetical protein